MDRLRYEGKPLVSYLKRAIERIDLGYTVACIEQEREDARAERERGDDVGGMELGTGRQK